MGDAWIYLKDLPSGFVFVTQDGTMAVKAAYRNHYDSNSMCFSLPGGEFTHFAEGNDTLVMALEVQLAAQQGECRCRCDACKYCEQLLEEEPS